MSKWAKEGATRLHVDPALNQAVVQETSSSAISLVVQWLILHASKTRGPGLTPGQGIRFHMLQQRVHTPQLRILLHATASIEDPTRCTF